jgi:transcriptional regulator with XRE-family HTH domain
MNNIHLGQRVEFLARQKGISVEQIAAALGRHEASVYEIFKKKDFTTAHLKIIADLMNLSLSVFFNEHYINQQGRINQVADQATTQYSKSGSNNMNADQQYEINRLKEKVESLTEQNKLLREMNELLKNRDK